MKKFRTKVIEDEESGDGILQLPPEICLEEDWRDGDVLNLHLKNGCIIINNLTKEERENLLK